jgi:DNA repair exonuclease SbcCD nuclease subunit
VKLLHSSDWHLDAVTYGVERYDELQLAVNETVDAAIAEECDAYFFTGDLCDPEDGARVLRSILLLGNAVKRLRDAEIVVVLLAGNHDVVEDGHRTTTLDSFHAWACRDSGIHVYTRQCFDIIEVARKWIGILALPFVSTGFAYDPDEFVRKMDQVVIANARDIPKIVIGHLHLDGAKVGEESTDMARGRPMQWPRQALREVMPRALLLGGHYHYQQEVDGIHIAGSLANLSFREEHAKPGYLIVEV